MKIKLLVVPVMVVAIVVLSIWLVYPAYSNGTDGFKEKRNKLAEEKKKLEEIKNKSANVLKLSSQLSSNVEMRDIVFSFIPETTKEEEIIDNLNFLAGSEGLSVTELSVTSQPAGENTPAVVGTGSVFSGTMAANAATSGTEGGEIAVSFAPQVKEAQVNFSVTGNYGQIKNLLIKVYGLKRFNNMESLEIRAANLTEEAKKDEPTDSLQAIMILKFNFIKKPVTAVSVEDPVFLRDSFDMKVINDIKSKRNIEVLKLDVGQAGRTNPFLP